MNPFHALGSILMVVGGYLVALNTTGLEAGLGMTAIWIGGYWFGILVQNIQSGGAA